MKENTAIRWLLFFPALFVYGLLHVYSSKPTQTKKTAELTEMEEAGRKVYNKYGSLLRKEHSQQMKTCYTY